METGLEKGDRGIVVDRIRMHRANQGNLVRNAAETWKKLGVQLHSRLSELVELENGSSHGKRTLTGGHASKSLSIEDRIGNFLPVYLVEMGLVVEEVVVRRSTALKEVDDSLRFGSDRLVDAFSVKVSLQE